MAVYMVVGRVFPSDDPTSPSVRWSTYLLVFGLVSIYFAVGSRFGGTIAHRTLGYSVVRVATGRPPGWGHSIVRAAVLSLAAFPLVWIPYLVVAWRSGSRQSPADLASGTVVVGPAVTGAPAE